MMSGMLEKLFSEENWGCDWTKERAELYLSDYVRNAKFVGFVSEEDGIVDGAIFACRKVSWNGDEIYVDDLIVNPQKHLYTPLEAIRIRHLH